MSGANLQFNAATVAPAKALDPMPSGWYNAKITDSGMEPTQKPGGQMLKLEMTVLDGPHAGRKLFDRLNLINDNPQAVQIAYEQLSSICHATGVINIQQTSAELHNIPLKVKVKLKPAESRDGKDYDARNEVKGYDNINADRPVVTAPAGGVAGAPQGTPAWAAGGQPAAAAAPVQAAPPAPASAPPVAFQPPVAAQPWANPAAAAPVAAPPPTAFVAPPPVAAPPAPAHIMLPAAGGTTYEAYIAAGWNDEQLIANGLMAAPAVAAPPAPPAPPAGVPAPATGAPVPPWQR